MVADGAKARFFTLETVERTKNKSSSYLIEHEDLINPNQDLSEKELWSSSQSQAGHYREGSSKAHSFDDHRQNHEIEFERRFAQEITSEVLKQIKIYQIQIFFLIAEPRLLGLLREVLIPMLPKPLIIKELNKNLCHLTSQELSEYLFSKDLLPLSKKASHLS